MPFLLVMIRWFYFVFLSKFEGDTSGLSSVSKKKWQHEIAA